VANFSLWLRGPQKFQSNAIAKDVQINTSLAVQFSDNFIDLVPLDESEITIDCEQQIPSLELVLRSAFAE